MSRLRIVPGLLLLLVAGAAALDPADVKAGDVDQMVTLLRRLERDVQRVK